jgi:hypothetical protein
MQQTLQLRFELTSTFPKNILKFLSPANRRLHGKVAETTIVRQINVVQSTNSAKMQKNQAIAMHRQINVDLTVLKSSLIVFRTYFSLHLILPLTTTELCLAFWSILL